MAEAAPASLDRARTAKGTHPSSLLVSLHNRLSKPAANSLPGVLGFARVDLHRFHRRGFPEVILANGKSAEQVVAIAKVLQENSNPVVVTKLKPRMANVLMRQLPWLRYFPQAKMAAFLGARRQTKAERRFVLVVTAGTGDIPVAEEAVVTLDLMGHGVKRLFDVGVAGLHRLLSNASLLRRAQVIIVVAGMDGALASVLSGLVHRPVIAVPTSVGYGASFKGVAPLLTMLNSCSPGVAVVNIDNGFGAGYLASMILSNR